MQVRFQFHLIDLQLIASCYCLALPLQSYTWYRVSCAYYNHQGEL